MKGKEKSDIENTEELPVIHPEEDVSDGNILPLFAKIGLFLAIVIVVTLISRFIYIKVNGETLSLIDDTQLVFSGHNGNGYADAVFHPENTALRKLKSDREQLKKHNRDTKDMDEFIASIGCSLDYKDHLSNGMNVTYTCDYDENAAKKAGYHVINDVRSYTVMGLSDYIYVDPYQDLQTEWDTESDTPVLKITPSAKNKDFFTYAYTYKGGDTAVIHVHPDETKLHQKGYEVRKSKLTRTIHVSPQPEKITDTQNLPANEISSLQEQAVQAYQKNLNSCNQYPEDNTSLLSSDVQIVSWSYNNDGTCTAILSITNTYAQNGTTASYTFTLCCTGTIWKNHDGTVSFSPQNERSCQFLRQGDTTVMDK